MEDAINCMKNWTFDLRAEFTEETDGTAEKLGPTDQVEVNVEDLKSILDDVAVQAVEVADEYESSLDNMPEGLQQGSTGEAMREVADNLRDWAENVRTWEPENVQVDLPEYKEEMDLEEWFKEAEQKVGSAVRDIRQSAESVMEDMPEYDE